MILCSPDSLPLSVWKRDFDSETSVCTYEDTIFGFPDAIKQGQNLQAVKMDFEKVFPYCIKHSNTQRGFPHYYIRSPHSIYGLANINNLGNTNHSAVCLHRTNVYMLDLDVIFSSHENVTLVLCSDGIKDVMSAEDIAAFTPDVSKGLRQLGAENDCYDKIIQSRNHVSLTPQSDKFKKRYGRMCKLPKKDTHDTFAIDQMRQILDSPNSLANFSNALVNISTLRKSGDDLTAIVVKLEKHDLKRSLKRARIDATEASKKNKV
jgi:serine/threonine protein phosphatase PrpC